MKIPRLPEMIVAKPMFDTPFKFSNIATPILTSMHSTAMTLATGPFSCINIPCVEPIHTITMPKTLPILPAVPATPSPCFYSIAIILPINPVPFVPPTHVIVIHTAT